MAKERTRRVNIIIVCSSILLTLAVLYFIDKVRKDGIANQQAWLANPISFKQAVDVSNEIWETKSYGLDHQLDPNDLSGMTGEEMKRMLENVGGRRGSAVFRTSITAASIDSVTKEGTKVLAEYERGHVLFWVKGKFILVEYSQICGPERTYLSEPYFMRKVGDELLISFLYDGRRKATLKQLGLPNEPSTCRWTERISNK